MMIIICIWLEKIYAYCGCESAHKMVFYVQMIEEEGPLYAYL